MSKRQLVLVGHVARTARSVPARRAAGRRSRRRADRPPWGPSAPDPPAITSRVPGSSVANARTSASRFLRGSIPPTKSAYGPSIPNRRRADVLDVCREARAYAAASTPSGATVTRPGSTSMRLQQVGARGGRRAPARRRPGRASRRTGGATARPCAARSPATARTRGRAPPSRRRGSRVAGGRKFVASSTSKSTDHSMRGMPSARGHRLEDPGREPRGPLRQVGGLHRARRTAGDRKMPFACRYQATYSSSGSMCGRWRISCCV